ncbi:MAG: ribosomal protein L7/L12 [Planctomycetota bacterium]|jgi:large subunit ribosomal protein L7/L12
MGRSRRARGRSGGGGGGAVTAIIIIGLLGGLAWFGWTRIQKANEPVKVPTGPRVTITTWQGRYRLTRGTVPETLPDRWLFSFEYGTRTKIREEQADYPSAWVEVQLEDGRFTGISIAEFRDAPTAGPYGLFTEDDFAGSTEGRQLRDLVSAMADMKDGTSVEQGTANFLFFAWKKQDDKALRKSVVCVVRKQNAPRAREMYDKARAAWTAGTAGGTAGAKGPRTKFDVFLIKVGKDRDAVMAAVCELLDVAPDVAGTLIDSAPKPIKQGVSRTEAESIKQKLEGAGAEAEIK